MGASLKHLLGEDQGFSPFLPLFVAFLEPPRQAMVLAGFDSLHWATNGSTLWAQPKGWTTSGHLSPHKDDVCISSVRRPPYDITQWTFRLDHD